MAELSDQMAAGKTDSEMMKNMRERMKNMNQMLEKMEKAK